MRTILVVASILSIFRLQGRDLVHPPEPPPVPWLTGPLIAPLGTVIEKGHVNINCYLYAEIETGKYNNNWHAHSTPNFYSINPQIFSIFGITEWLDFQITPQFEYNFTRNQSSVLFGDLPLGFDIQVIGPDLSKWFPGIKLFLKETFPTGKYQKLKPEKLKTDASGMGTFATDLGIVLYQVYRLEGHHFLSVTLSYDYSMGTPVDVEGFNAYGGSSETNGTVWPGNTSTTICSFEYTINQNWVFAIDNIYTHTNQTRFSGFPENTLILSSDQISFAPAIEYNFSSKIGIIAGIWFSAFGRNIQEFCNGVINFDLNY